MNIHLARHHGMCFGVRAALRATHDAARSEPVTLLGQLVHNPLVDRHLDSLGVRRGSLDHASAAPTRRVVISAHGTSSTRRQELDAAGLRVTDTTCPLVRKAHDALALLVREGFAPVVIGRADHAEVRGLIGDHPGARVILSEEDIDKLPFQPRFGVVSQTTQPLELALHLVDLLKRRHPAAEVRFLDTVCHPTKDRQQALEDLCGFCDTLVIIGGRNSNNTRQLLETARRRGRLAFQVEHAGELDPAWFRRAENVGVTAGTSTLDETVAEVIDRLGELARESAPRSLWSALFGRPSSPVTPHA